MINRRYQHHTKPNKYCFPHFSFFVAVFPTHKLIFIYAFVSRFFEFRLISLINIYRPLHDWIELNPIGNLTKWTKKTKNFFEIVIVRLDCFLNIFISRFLKKINCKKEKWGINRRPQLIFPMKSQIMICIMMCCLVCSIFFMVFT